jgi:hypothetical protein
MMLARVTPVSRCNALYETPLSTIVRRSKSEIGEFDSLAFIV